MEHMPTSTCQPQQSAIIVQIVEQTPWLMQALELARDTRLPDAWIGAGAIRDVVWEARFGPPASRVAADIDLVYYDAMQHDRRLEQTLADTLEQKTGLKWDVTNQAMVHTWYEASYGIALQPYQSSADAIACWPETATCIAARLTQDDTIEVLAPLGLDDLLSGVIRHNTALVTEAMFDQRIAQKNWQARWPALRLLHDARPGR